MFDFIKIWPQYVIPQHGLTGIMYRLTRIQFKPWKNLMIKLIIYLYKVDMSQARREKPEDYVSFNDFFTRYLKDDARTFQLDKQNIISPVDGAISQIGKVDGSNVFQAKGRSYSLEQLLTNDADAVNRLRDGLFTTLYLSPRDYHRIHMPVSGTLLKSTYVPGDLFSVNNVTVNNVDNLFARNERFVSLFETEVGLMAQIMVGAFFVGSMQTVWSGQITPAKKREITVQEYEDKPVILEQGMEFGNFNMGSTVILIFEQDKISWLQEMKAEDSIQVGQLLGKVT